MSKAKGTVHIRVTGTVPLVNNYLAVFWSGRFTLEKKRNRKKNYIKTCVSAKNCFDCRFFDLDFSLKSFWTGLASEILCHKNNIVIKII